MKILDVDFGGTVCDNEDVPNWTPENNSLQSTLHPDQDWNGHLERPPFPGCFDVLSMLRESGFAPPGVVSKIEMLPLIQIKIRRWFVHHDRKMVIPVELIRFCGTWEEKLGLCLERRTTHFIDNQLKPLAPMVGMVPHLYLFRPPERGRDANLWHLVESKKITLINSWKEFGEKVLHT